MISIGNIECGNFPLLLAPMEDVTDSSFRSICKSFGADILITEFISSEGLIRDAAKSRVKLTFGEEERPLGIQIFGNDINSMRKATMLAEQAKPDFIDINFGCPVKKVVVKGAGAALLNDLPKMISLTAEVVRSTSLPVTVKTRLGWDESSRNIVKVAEMLQDTGIQAISIHGRTRAQLYGGKADWTLIGEVKNNPRMKIPVFGNGDISNALIAKEMKEIYGVDGLMIGRAAIGNPWIFREIKTYLTEGILIEPPSLQERVDILKKHLFHEIANKGERIAILEMRKFYSGYFKDLPDFKKHKMRLMTAQSEIEINEIIKEFTIDTFPSPGGEG
ncbi:MAG: tRNA dihydrouridine synthase DusB [Bacteroidetes bacterium]|nr:tRNA dihydrouridine synthase DusB [Bacteroidota bacterium]